MTKEAEQYVKKLDTLQSLCHDYVAAKKHCKEVLQEQERKLSKLRSQYKKKLEEHSETAPTAPAKKELKALLPSVTRGGIRFTVALLFCILCLVISVLSQVKSARLEALSEEPGEAYAAWCDALMSKEDLAKMTEAEWEPVREEWKQEGINVDWNEVVALNEEGVFEEAQGPIYSHSTANYVRREMLKPILEKKEPSAFGFVVSALLAFVSLCALVVFREGFSSLKKTVAGDIWRIPAVNKQKKEAKIFNQNEYPRLLCTYEEAKREHEEKAKEIESAKEAACQKHRENAKAISEPHLKKREEILKKCKDLCFELSFPTDVLSLYERLDDYDLDDIDISYVRNLLEGGTAETPAEALNMLHDLRKKSRAEANAEHAAQVAKEKEALAERSKQFWDEIETAKKEQEAKEEAERNARWEEKKRSDEERIKKWRREEQAREKCRGCENYHQCNTAAILNSLSCGAYRPKKTKLF